MRPALAIASRSCSSFVRPVQFSGCSTSVRGLHMVLSGSSSGSMAEHLAVAAAPSHTAILSTLMADTDSAVTAVADTAPTSGVFDAPVAGQMGAHVDLGATAVFLFISLAFLLLRIRVGSAMQARETRATFESTLQAIELRVLTGAADQSELDAALDKLTALQEKEEAARTVSGPLGYSFRLMVPGAPSSQPQRRRSSSQNSSVQSSNNSSSSSSSNRDSSSSSNSKQSDSDELQKLSPVQLAVLALVVLSQLWLLAVLSADPMAPPSDMFYSAFGNQS
eukprot:21252-Heterococcus_DN1.PRE.5